MVIVISPKRCGSTIIQNITYFIINKKRGLVRKYHHNIMGINEKKIIIIRDPRDVVLSMRRTVLLNHALYRKVDNLAFLDNNIIKNVLDQMIPIYNGNKDKKTALILRYEEVFKGGLGTYDIVVNKISKFLNIKVTSDLMDNINKEFNFKKMKLITSNLKSFLNTDNNTTGYCFHGYHIANNKVTNWKDVIPSELHNELNEKLRPYLVGLGYGI